MSNQVNINSLSHEDIISIILNDAYQKHTTHLTRILRYYRIPLLNRFTRFKRGLQISLLQELIFYVQQRTKHNNTPELREVTRKIIDVALSVGDAIAFRELGYKRAQIRIMSENQGPGLKEEELARQILILQELKSNFIANDTTHYLRCSDFTELLDDKVILWELKARGDSAKLLSIREIYEKRKKQRIPQLFSNQELRQIISQFAFIDGDVRVPDIVDGRVREERIGRIRDLDFKIKSHHILLRKLIKDSQKNGYASTLFERGFAAEVYDIKKINPDVDTIGGVRNKNVDIHIRSFREPTLRLLSHNLYFIKGSEFARNITPPTFLPISSKHAMRIINGELILNIAKPI